LLAIKTLSRRANSTVYLIPARARIGSELQPVSGWLDLRIARIFGVRIWIWGGSWILFVDALEIHTQPHHRLL